VRETLRRGSVLVVVLTMDGVAVTVVHVVDVVTMRNGHVATPFTVRMAVVGVRMRLVVARLALVEMPVVRPVEVAVVHEIDVITVRDGHMTAAFAVDVAVTGVFKVCRGHELPASRCLWASRTRTSQCRH
jgi:hypothetical protein